MADGTLYLGTRRYSSWSMRGWLLVALAGLDVDERVIPLGEHGTAELAAISPTGLVPYLEHRDLAIWDSMAIAEYCAELNPILWPLDRPGRTRARVIAAEMHSGFRGLRSAMPMNLTRHAPGGGQTADALADLKRIEALWRETRAQFGGGGPYLFGATFNAADAIFAPIVTRLLTYGPPIAADTAAYCHAVRQQPHVSAWYDAAATEPEAWKLAKYENAG